MTDFTTQITASSTALDVANILYGYAFYGCDDEVVKRIAAIIAADRAARARGFTPGERMPSIGERVWCEAKDGSRYPFKLSSNAKWFTDSFKSTVRRWWHLPGEGR